MVPRYSKRTLKLRSCDLRKSLPLYQTSNLIINLDHDDWLLTDDTKTLDSLGFENETEVSFFNLTDYNEFKQNPETSWAC
ncbi:hypothetical protein H1R20_g3117, partial [Candolleomyces eurysporus]